MKKVTAFIGSARKKATYQAVQEFERDLKELGSIDFEYVFLNEYNLEFCQGCKLCFDRGEEYCPIKDDRNVLLEKLEHSDGVIFAAPNYAFHVSARMKNFIDRFAYIFHRPRFFGKTFTAIATQGVFGGKAIRKYLESTGINFGFNVTKGTYLTTLEPMTKLQEKRLKSEIKKASVRFFKRLNSSAVPAPSFFRLMLFRITRTCLKNFDIKLRDYHYYKEHGWFESDYYNDTPMGPFKKAAGLLFDMMGRIMVKHM